MAGLGERSQIEGFGREQAKAKKAGQATLSVSFVGRHAGEAWLDHRVAVSAKLGDRALFVSVGRSTVCLSNAVDALCTS